MKALKQEKLRVIPPERFVNHAERDAYIVNHADYFTVGRRIGPREGYERHEVESLVDAKILGRRMANETGKIYLLYAVAGLSDAFIEAIHPDPTHA